MWSRIKVESGAVLDGLFDAYRISDMDVPPKSGPISPARVVAVRHFAVSPENAAPD